MEGKHAQSVETIADCVALRWMEGDRQSVEMVYKPDVVDGESGLAAIRKLRSVIDGAIVPFLASGS